MMNDSSLRVAACSCLFTGDTDTRCFFVGEEETLVLFVGDSDLFRGDVDRDVEPDEG
jgi:hypothetical protein